MLIITYFFEYDISSSAAMELGFIDLEFVFHLVNPILATCEGHREIMKKKTNIQLYVLLGSAFV